MSHKVGGLGLNLTAANRIILLGANFNPSLDSQSIFRAYRFGQKKTVYIYRLLSKVGLFYFINLKVNIMF